MTWSGSTRSGVTWSGASWRRALAIVAATLALGCAQTRDPETVPCTPGEGLTVGCGACGVGSCAGDPVLRVCDGASDVRACADALGILAESDDACGSPCPATQVTCPASGRITVIHRAFGAGGYECSWEVRAAAEGDGGL